MSKYHIVGSHMSRLIYVFCLQRDPNKDYKSTDDPGLKFEFINTVYDLILGLVGRNSEKYCWTDLISCIESLT